MAAITLKAAATALSATESQILLALRSAQSGRTYISELDLISDDDYAWLYGGFVGTVFEDD